MPALTDKCLLVSCWLAAIINQGCRIDSQLIRRPLDRQLDEGGQNFESPAAYLFFCLFKQVSGQLSRWI